MMLGIGNLLRGMAIGFSIAAPVGPIGVLCIRRTLDHGRAVGFASGLGAAAADAAYGCIAGFGLTLISNVLIGQQVWLRLVGGLFLCYLGVRAFVARPAEPAASPGRRGLLGAYGSTLLLTLTNPMTILSFAAVYAGLGIGSARGGYGAAAMLVLGTFAGSALWWLTLSSFVSVLRTRLGSRVLQWVNRSSGVVLVGFGLAALLSLTRT